MMKTTLSLLMASLCAIASAAERTWTSANGKRTMEATFISAEGEMATINRNGHILTFRVARLSQTDQDWIKAQAAPVPAALSPEEFAASPLGKALSKTKKLNGKQFVAHTIKPTPKFFFLYYSASW